MLKATACPILRLRCPIIHNYINILPHKMYIELKYLFDARPLWLSTRIGTNSAVSYFNSYYHFYIATVPFKQDVSLLQSSKLLSPNPCQEGNESHYLLSYLPSRTWANTALYHPIIIYSFPLNGTRHIIHCFSYIVYKRINWYCQCNINLRVAPKFYNAILYARGMLWNRLLT